MTLYQLREKFPHTRDLVYVNHAATGPLSRPVKTAMDRFVEERHRAPIDNYDKVLPRIEDTREMIGKLLGTTGSRIALTANTSSALNLLALGLAWEQGDRIAVPSCEFPANVYPFLNLEDRAGVTVDFIPHREGYLTLEDIERTLRPETRLLSISWVQFLSGFRVDLAAVVDLCRAYDVLCSVDAIQGLGALQMDVESLGVDFVASGCHKWLMGAQGLGFLYVSEELQQRIDPPMAGWLHGPVDWKQLFDYELSFHGDATRFHLGTMNHLGVTALNAALRLYFDADPELCEERVLTRSRQLTDGFQRLDIKQYGSTEETAASGIVSIEHPRVEELCGFLEDHGVAASLRDEKLRFSPTYYNTAGEIDYVLNLIETFEFERVSPNE